MNLPKLVTQLIHPKPEDRELFLSLLLDIDVIAAAAWYVDPAGQPHLLSHASAHVAADSWEHRTEMTDSLLTVVEDKAGSKTAISKVVLGLPQRYLAADGSIASNVRAPIKVLTRALDLSAVGFVPVHEALAYMLKREDGVPASAIFLDITKEDVTVFLYRVGNLVGSESMSLSPDMTVRLEEVLKKFQDHDVLPSRMLLYGADSAKVEEIRAELLKYPWTTRANFLHFPKIETLPIDAPIGAVCFAGARELGGTIAQAPAMDEALASPEEEQVEAPEEKTEIPVDETSNVVEVAPEDLGFKSNTDVLASVAPPVSPSEDSQAKLDISGFIAGIGAWQQKLPKLSLPTGTNRMAPIIMAALLVIALLGIGYWSLPKATITVLVSPKTIQKTATATVSPTATAVDTAASIVPGSVQEKSVTGEKTLAVTGKKNVGDPAKGTVTIYNKATAARILSKGAVLTSGSLQFTLDEEVQIASATEKLGGKDYGSKDALITASAIGPASNLPAGTEFIFRGIDRESLSANNGQALAGGTSREVTVVSRADYDAVVKALTDELLTKAKEELAGGVEGGQRLIDATVKTAVTERTFAQELDQEAQAVSGKITLTISGLSYNEGDLSAMLSGLAQPDVPSGYTLAPSRTSVTINSAQVQTNGNVRMGLGFSALALPQMDEAALKSAITGKSLDGAKEALSGFEGVAGIEVAFRNSPWKNRLPVNRNNISISVAISQ